MSLEVCNVSTATSYSRYLFGVVRRGYHHATRGRNQTHSERHEWRAREYSVTHMPAVTITFAVNCAHLLTHRSTKLR